jgi:hypothetical protein
MLPGCNVKPGGSVVAPIDVLWLLQLSVRVSKHRPVPT